MKKTIAILLVLVIGMAGVFAATADRELSIKTSVSPINGIIVTPYTAGGAPLDSTSTYADFSVLTAFDIASDIVTVAKTAENVYTPVGYLNYYSNQAASFSASLEAAPMTSETVDSEIDYTVRVGSSDSYITKTAESATIISLRDYTEGTTLTSTIGSKLVDVKVDDDSWDSAMVATDYEGIITFTFTTI